MGRACWVGLAPSLTMRAHSTVENLMRSTALAMLGLSFLAVPALSQSRCSAGTTLSGGCADAGLVQSMSQRALVFSQPRISFLGLPLATRSNSYADAVRDRESLRYGITGPAPTAGTPPPAPGTFIGLPANVDPSRLQIGVPYTVVPGGIRTR